MRFHFGELFWLARGVLVNESNRYLSSAYLWPETYEQEGCYNLTFWKVGGGGSFYRQCLAGLKPAFIILGSVMLAEIDTNTSFRCILHKGLDLAVE